MTSLVLTPVTASLSELSNDPMKTLEKGEGQPVAILHHDQPAFYCLPPELYEQLVEIAEDEESNAIADARLSDGQKAVTVSFRDL